jgi:hypothetical protein
MDTADEAGQRAALTPKSDCTRFRPGLCLSPTFLAISHKECFLTMLPLTAVYCLDDIRRLSKNRFLLLFALNTDRLGGGEAVSVMQLNRDVLPHISDRLEQLNIIPCWTNVVGYFSWSLSDIAVFLKRKGLRSFLGRVWYLFRDGELIDYRKVSLDTEITGARELIGVVEQRRTNQIVINYRREDSQDVTDRLFDRLAGHFGSDVVFRDVNSIPSGRHFPRELAQVMNRCNILLVVMGARWATVVDNSGKRRLDDPSDWVRKEIETAIKRRIAIVPILVQGARLPSKRGLPANLRGLTDRQAITVGSDPHFDADVDRLLAWLKIVLSGG